MQLNHVGLNIAGADEIRNFYQDILGFLPERDFLVPRELSQMFFDIDDEPEVVVLQNGNLKLELFVNDKSTDCGYTHLCIEMKDRDEIIRKCEENGYPVIRIKREKNDLIFVKDKAGNLFELKDKTV